VKILKFIRDNLSFIITFSIVLSVLYGILFLLRSPFYLNFLRVNFMFGVALFLIPLFPYITIKNSGLKEIFPVNKSWFFLLLIITIYFEWFRQPDLVLFFSELFRGNFGSIQYLLLFSGILSYCGIIYSFYYFMVIKGDIDPTDTLLTEKNNHQQDVATPVTLSTYSIWLITFLIYVNFLLILTHRFFQRPF